MQLMENERTALAGRIREALVQLSQIANQPACAGPRGWSQPNSRLLQDNLERVVDYIIYTRRGEYRLNGSGLKLYFSTGRCFDTQQLRLCMNVAGDQARYYQQFVRQSNAMLAEQSLRGD